MTNEELFTLMDRFEHSSLSRLKLDTADYKLELERQYAVQAPASPAPAPQSAPAPAPKADAPTVNAPLVGTFYTAPAPGEAPYVQVGDRVKKGQTLCLMEAMKMMSEIPAPCDLIVEEVMQENGALVSFGDPLLRYRAV